MCGAEVISRRLAGLRPTRMVWVPRGEGEGVIDSSGFLRVVSLWHVRISAGGDEEACMRSAWRTGRLG